MMSVVVCKPGWSAPGMMLVGGPVRVETGGENIMNPSFGRLADEPMMVGKQIDFATPRDQRKVEVA